MSLPPSVRSFRSVTPPRPVSRIEVLHRHDRYYLEDGVVFLVQDTLFKIPRYMFIQESPIFADMFRLPLNSSTAEGNADTTPIRLNKVEALDFERLVELLYPRKFSNFTTGTHHWGESEWKSILNLASMWEMLDVRSEAIAQLSKCAGPATKILLGRMYDHPPWVRDGFLQFCLRHGPLTIEEAEELGSMKEIVGIAEARESVRSEVTSTYFDQEDYYQHPKVHQILDQIFGILPPVPETPCGTVPNSPVSPFG